jgi:D-alanyl-D-alanine dipeptidase
MLVRLLLVVSCCGYRVSRERAARETEIPENKYGLEVIENQELYLRTVAEDPSKELVDVEREVPGICIDVCYATTDNFMREQLYPVAKVYLRGPAAEALAGVQEALKERGLELKVFDGYRPYEVTQKIWEPYQNPDFVADPAEGSRHNRGCAVDVTLVDENWEELPMPPDTTTLQKGPATITRTCPKRRFPTATSCARRWRATASRLCRPSGGTTTTRDGSGSSC